MRKLKLDLDRMVVESFETGREREPRKGTVRGQAETDPCTVDDWTCGQYTCDRRFGSCPAESCGACGTYYCGG